MKNANKLLLALAILATRTGPVSGMDNSYESCVINHTQKAKRASEVAIIKNTCKEKYGLKEKTNNTGKSYLCTPNAEGNDFCSFLIEKGKAIRAFW